MDSETDRRKSGVYRFRNNQKSCESVTIGKAIHQVLNNLGLTQKFREQRVLSLWSQVVGERIAEVTHADAIRRGELYVSVIHDTWRHRLLFERENIQKRLNDAVGNDTVRIIRFTR